MTTNVSTLLREFPKVRQAAMRGERVVIKTREGNLILTAEAAPAGRILDSLQGGIAFDAGTDLTLPTAPEKQWIP